MLIDYSMMYWGKNTKQNTQKVFFVNGTLNNPTATAMKLQY